MTKNKKEKSRKNESDDDMKYSSRYRRSQSVEDDRRERKKSSHRVDQRSHRDEKGREKHKTHKSRVHLNSRRSSSRSQSEEPASRSSKPTRISSPGSRKEYSRKHQAERSSSTSSNEKKGRSKHSERRKEENKTISSDTDKKGSSHSKHRHNRHASSSESTEDSDEAPDERSEDLVKRLQEERKRLKDEKRRQKEQTKVTETPEEKRLRRLLKKEAKERKRKERMGWDKDYMHYTNTDNPFGDANLLDTFVWSKKLDKEGLSKMDHEEMERRNRLKQEENRLELEKVKKRRQEWEQERARREDELQLLQRQKEAAQFREWEKQEDNFHLQQARLRSTIRIQDGRAKPIDLLAKYISAEEEDLAVEMHEPYTYLNGLTITDLEDLLEDIKVYMELEKGRNLDYWNDITIIVDDELGKLCKLDTKEHFGDRREGIHASVSSDILTILKGKTQVQLLAMQQNIQQKIHGGEEGIDIGYWESVLKQVVVHMARARLRDRHQDNLRRKLFQLKQEQGVKTEPLFPILASEEDEVTIPVKSEPVAETETNIEHMQEELPGPSSTAQVTEEVNDNVPDEESENAVSVEDLLSQCFVEYTAGCYSPKFLQPHELEPGTIITEQFEDSTKLQYTRQLLIGTVGTGTVQDILTAEEKAFEREARKGMDDEEALFSVESPVDKVYLWSDKYRPRKPRYFNRVHTGFEWNKYNQTHYDMDNPPPKIVQGYKFNIFYPDLIEKGSSPEYTLTPCDNNKDFAILRFRSTPPYEDIAFKIVNREWEYSYKRGFRCQFHNNIFQLWFHFKRYRYRR